jgi:hypothetical protein
VLKVFGEAGEQSFLISLCIFLEVNALYEHTGVISITWVELDSAFLLRIHLLEHANCSLAALSEHLDIFVIISRQSLWYISLYEFHRLYLILLK